MPWIIWLWVSGAIGGNNEAAIEACQNVEAPAGINVYWTPSCNMLTQ